MDNTEIARWCHEINRTIQDLIGEEVSEPWHLAPIEIQNSAITGVNKAKAGLSARDLHEAWVDYKVAEGWVYGEEKNLELKTHPCLVPYEELSTEQKLKDAVFRAVVNAFNS